MTIIQANLDWLQPVVCVLFGRGQKKGICPAAPSLVEKAGLSATKTNCFSFPYKDKAATMVQSLDPSFQIMKTMSTEQEKLVSQGKNNLQYKLAPQPLLSPAKMSTFKILLETLQCLQMNRSLSCHQFFKGHQISPQSLNFIITRLSELNQDGPPILNGHRVCTLWKSHTAVVKGPSGRLSDWGLCCWDGPWEGQRLPAFVNSMTYLPGQTEESNFQPFISSLFLL